MIRLLTIVLFICFTGIDAFAQNGIKKETFVYAVKDTDTLRLDKYILPSVKGNQACIVFMFGGGFTSGTRDHQNYISYFEYLAGQGYTVVSIDYRLGMKNLKTSDLMRTIATLKNSISIAVEDLFDATSFIVDHAKDWQIDENKIIANGSSAGAVSVLHGAYAIANNEEVTKKLPANFNYAGVISFAGAIFSTNGQLEWKRQPAPIQLFHGDADSNVPYNKVELSNYGFYGSKFIGDQLHKLNYPNYLYIVNNAAHEMADLPMTDNLMDIETFIKKFALKKEKLIIRTGEIKIGKPEMNKDFEITDYIKSNFGN